jgi:glycine dehydrogenase
VAVRAHLAPYLPSHEPGNPVGPVSGAALGSAGVLPISYAYVAQSGPDGLRAASAGAIAAANYLARRLSPAYPILYTGAAGLVAHECIVDLRELTAGAHLNVDDVAKRLIDYGFHAPTMSFPVPGTLMVEPTESESLAELDRCVDAMLAIRAEIAEVRAGRWPADDNPLVNAPHPLSEVLATQWSHPYPRDVAACGSGFSPGPISAGGRDKYWAPVARIDQAWGDRNLICRLELG